MPDQPIIIYRNETEYHLDQFRLDFWRFIADHPFWIVGIFACFIIIVLAINFYKETK